MNLKGPVVQVVEEAYGVKEAFGEWEKGDKCLSRLTIFNDNGLLLLDTKEPIQLNFDEKTEYVSDIGRIPVVKKVLIYSYDSSNRVSHVECVQTISTDYLAKYEDLPAWYVDYTKWGKERVLKLYDYNADGTLKSITSRLTLMWYDIEPTIVGKDVYKYNSDGYEIWFYDSDGTRNTRKLYNVIQSERKIQKRDDGAVTEFYNNQGQLEASAMALTASNGQLRGDYFYGYNGHGDLKAIASSLDAVKSVKGFEDFYPIIKDNLKSNNIVAYEYEYDSHDNWVVRKEYKVRGQEVIVSGWVERIIRYADGTFDGESYCKNLVSSLNSKVSVDSAAEKARKEWESLEPWSEIASDMKEWLKSHLSYPDPSTTLASLLSVNGSVLYIDLCLRVDETGKITTPSSIVEVDYSSSYGDNIIQWRFHNKKSYWVNSARAKDEAKVKAEVTEMLNQLLEDLKDAPIGTRGQNSSQKIINIKFEEGKVKIHR